MIIIGADHAGVDLKKNIISYLRYKGIAVKSVENNTSTQNDDYPDVAYKVATEVASDENNVGIAICGTGIGISIACNKVKGIRAALCMDDYTAEMCRRHNNANILCLGARTTTCQDFDRVHEIVDIFLNTGYDGDRHERRLQKIKMIEDGTYVEGEE